MSEPPRERGYWLADARVIGSATIIGTFVAIAALYYVVEDHRKTSLSSPAIASYSPTPVFSPSSNERGPSPTLTAPYFDVEGAWVGEEGMCHLILQDGPELQVANYDPFEHFKSLGAGSIHGRTVDLVYELNGEEQNPVLNLVNLPDAKHLIGRTHRPDRPGFDSNWKYRGRTCPNPLNF